MQRKLIWGMGGFLLVVILIAVLITANRTRIVSSQIERLVKQSVGAQNASPSLFEIVFCGTGSPQFQADRRQSCTAIVAGQRLFLFDAGQGAAQGLQAAKAPFHSLETIFLTHLHSDHVSGVGDVLHNSWLYGRQGSSEIIGPPGTQNLHAGVIQSFNADLEERWHTIGSEYRDPVAGMGKARDVLVAGRELQEVYNKDGIKISTFRVEHPNWDHAYGYRFEHKNVKIVISGDTRYAPNLIRHADGADILIHEALNIDMMQTIAGALKKHGGGIDPARMELITNVHTPTHDLAKLAKEADVEHLVLTHLIPPIPASNFVEVEFIKGMNGIYDGNITVARDGMRMTFTE